MFSATIRGFGWLILVTAPWGVAAAVIATVRNRTRELDEVEQTPVRTDAEPPAGPGPSPFQVLWMEAESGNARAVTRLLRQSDIAPDTPHPEHGTHLVLFIAAVSTFSERLDAGLANVLGALRDAGWSLAPQMESGDNALHLLVRQDRCCQVSHRLKLITTAEMASPKQDNMLTVVNNAGTTPEGEAAANRAELVAFLHVKQLQIKVAAERAWGVPRGMFARIRGAWLDARGHATAQALQ